MKKDYTQEYYEKWNALRKKRRAERRAQENHSNFTTCSLVGISIGAGFGYQTEFLIPLTILSTIIGALLGAFLDWKSIPSSKR